MHRTETSVGTTALVFLLVVLLLAALAVVGPGSARAATTGTAATSNEVASAFRLLMARGVLDPSPKDGLLPQAPVTRAEFLKMLVLARGFPIPAATQLPFPDVPKGSWEDPYLAAAVAAGVVLPRAAPFDPSAPLTRSDLALFLGRALGLDAMAATAPPPPFADNAAIPPAARGFVSALAQLGILTAAGPGGRFAPAAPVSRGEAAVVVAEVLRLGPNGLALRLDRLARRVAVAVTPAELRPGERGSVRWSVFGPGGEVLPVRPAFTSPLGTVEGGAFLALRPGVGLLVAEAGRASGSAAVRVADVASRLVVRLPTSAMAGSAFPVEVEVLDARGLLDASDQGRTVTLAVYGPGTSSASQAVDRGGVATVDLTLTQAATYRLVASAAGLESGTASLSVAPGPPARLAVTSDASALQGLGSQATVTVDAFDAFGNLATRAQGAVLWKVRPAGALSLAASETPLRDGEATTQVSAQVYRGPAEVEAIYGSLTASLILPVAAGPELQVVVGTGHVTAGTPVAVQVDALGPGAQVLPQDSGRPITLTVSGPGGVVRERAVDDGGVATFTVREDEAGTYTLTAVAPGSATSAPGTLTVVPGPPAALSLLPAPSFLLLPGESASLSVTVTDAYGNPVPTTVPIQMAASGTAGTLTQVPALAVGGSAVARFAASTPGQESVTVSAPGLAGATVGLTVEGAVYDALQGKGMWLMYQDLAHYGAQNIVRTASRDGIRYLFLEVGSTYQGYDFWGAKQLDQLLPLAHAHDIAVLAWVYDTLENIPADLKLATTAYDYTTPDGERVDGLALDLETDQTMTPSVVGPFLKALDAALPPSALVAAVTYPPQDRPHYPYATLAQGTSAILPMDYWHSRPTSYTPADVAAFVGQSVTMLRRLSGDPGLVVGVIGQGFDMFADSGTGIYSPTPAEVQAAVEAAGKAGAIGFSLYRWGTATDGEWQAFLDTPLPTGASTPVANGP